MGVGTVTIEQLDDFVRAVDAFGGLGSPLAVEYVSDFKFDPCCEFDESLDPFGDDYLKQQIELYRMISGRELNQETGELTELDVEAHASGVNPYRENNISLVARHSRAIMSILVRAKLPNGARILDLGCGWGLSSEMMAFAGAQVVAVDINPDFVALVQKRADRLGLPIRAIIGSFDNVDVGTSSFDLAVFYECLHHAVQPWVTLQNVVSMLAPCGKIAFAGEPINKQWKHWGLRFDAQSIYCIRKYGWFESGWSLSFLKRVFERVGMKLTVLYGEGLDGGAIGIAVRKGDKFAASSEISDVIVAHHEAKWQLHSLRNSRSWRLTRPLRAIGLLLKRNGRRKSRR